MFRYPARKGKVQEKVNSGCCGKIVELRRNKKISVNLGRAHCREDGLRGAKLGGGGGFVWESNPAA